MRLELIFFLPLRVGIRIPVVTASFSAASAVSITSGVVESLGLRLGLTLTLTLTYLLVKLLILFSVSACVQRSLTATAQPLVSAIDIHSCRIG